jgi:hypothetical protein
MAELDKRIDPDKGKSPRPGKVAGGVSGNSAESRQHQEDKVGSRRSPPQHRSRCDRGE